MANLFGSNMNEMVNRAAEILNELDSPLLIIDEAEKLNHTMILYLHVLRDKTKTDCGIVLVGIPYFKTDVQHYAHREKEGYAEYQYLAIICWPEWKENKGNMSSEQYY